MTEIKPYGEEWVQEMMKFKKLDIIKILRDKIFFETQRVNAAMEAAKVLKEQRDEAYAEIRRVVSIKEKQRAALEKILMIGHIASSEIARAALEREV